MTSITRVTRRAFTLVEFLIATSIAFGILAIAWGFIWQYSRAYGTRDENLERSRKLQSILDSMRDDIDRARGSFGPDTFPAEGLKAVGFTGSPENFVTRPRRGTNIINAYRQSTDTHPYLSKEYAYREVWKIVTDPAGNRVLELDKRATGYSGSAPPQYIWDPVEERYIRPLGGESCFHVSEPPEGDESHFYAFLKGGNEPVLWAYHRKATGPFAAGSLVRWSPRTRLTVLEPRDLKHFQMVLFGDWAFWDKDPPKRPDPWVLRSKGFLSIRLGFEEHPPKADLPRDKGAFEDLRILISPPTS